MIKTFEVLVFPRNNQTLISITKDGLGMGSFMLEDEDNTKIQSIKDLIDGWNIKQQEGELSQTPETITGRSFREDAKTS